MQILGQSVGKLYILCLCLYFSNFCQDQYVIKEVFFQKAVVLLIVQPSGNCAFLKKRLLSVFRPLFRKFEVFWGYNFTFQRVFFFLFLFADLQCQQAFFCIIKGASDNYQVVRVPASWEILFLVSIFGNTAKLQRHNEANSFLSTFYEFASSS